MPIQSRTSPIWEQYAAGVLDGRIVAGNLVGLACERHFRDLKDGQKRGLYFDPSAANHAIGYFQFLKHWNGRDFAGKTFALEPWQQFGMASLFGWKNAEGLRRFRTGYIEVSRGNGKTTWAAGVGLYLAFADGEPGAEVYCAATKKDQARIVFKDALQMRLASPDLRSHIQAFRDNLSDMRSGSKFEPLGADADTLDGLKPHGLIIDEVHKHKDRSVWDVLQTAMIKRRQPLTFAITTAGDGGPGIYLDLRNYAESVLEDTIQDDRYWCFPAVIDKEDDWEDEKCWPKANPNFGVSVVAEEMRTHAHTAKNQPAALNAFLRDNLGRPASAFARWIPPDKWNACVGYSLKGKDAKSLLNEILPTLHGRRCVIGIDLSETLDMTSAVKVFEPTEDDPRVFLIPRFYMPMENILEREKKDRIPYQMWAREQFITLTDGEVVDYDFILKDILEDSAKFQIGEIAFDPWNCRQFATNLMKHGFTVVEIRQGIKTCGEPSKRFLEYIYQKKIVHLGHPVLKFNAHNAVVRMDENGNVMPSKKKSTGKIDGLHASINGFSRIIFSETQESAYEKHGIQYI
jgi:phage terminase large subunit-like protein